MSGGTSNDSHRLARALGAAGIEELVRMDPKFCPLTTRSIARSHGLLALPCVHTYPKESQMLWTILVVLAIIALAIFIFSRVRGGRGV